MASNDAKDTPELPPMTPQQAKKLRFLETHIPKLHEQVTETEASLQKAREKLKELSVVHKKTFDENAIVREHIRLLHDYNEIKDVGQGLIGIIAQSRGVRHIDVLLEFGMGTSD